MHDLWGNLLTCLKQIRLDLLLGHSGSDNVSCNLLLEVAFHHRPSVLDWGIELGTACWHEDHLGKFVYPLFVFPICVCCVTVTDP